MRKYNHIYVRGDNSEHFKIDEHLYDISNMRKLGGLKGPNRQKKFANTQRLGLLRKEKDLRLKEEWQSTAVEGIK